LPSHWARSVGPFLAFMPYASRLCTGHRGILHAYLNEFDSQYCDRPDMMPLYL
jgi:hypothetical protein